MLEVGRVREDRPCPPGCSSGWGWSEGMGIAQEHGTSTLGPCVDVPAKADSTAQDAPSRLQDSAKPCIYTVLLQKQLIRHQRDGVDTEPQ